MAVIYSKYINTKYCKNERANFNKQIVQALSIQSANQLEETLQKKS